MVDYTGPGSRCQADRVPRLQVPGASVLFAATWHLHIAHVHSCTAHVGTEATVHLARWHLGPRIIQHRVHRLLGAHPHRPCRRHARHLAALPLSRGRADAKRGDQPAGPLLDPAAPRSPHGDRLGGHRHRVDAGHWSELTDNPELRLLGRLLHHFQAEGLELRTRSESPVGAGIAGSSALNIAVCGALTAWTERQLTDDRCCRWR